LRDLRSRKLKSGDLCRWEDHGLAVLVWGLLKPALKKEIEVGNAIEPNPFGHHGNEQIGGAKELPRTFEAYVCNVGLWRRSQPFVKFPPHLRWAYTGIGNQLLHGHVRRFVDLVQYWPKPGRQAHNSQPREVLSPKQAPAQA